MCEWVGDFGTKEMLSHCGWTGGGRGGCFNNLKYLQA